jgi:predicted aconitase with swiveling domain
MQQLQVDGEANKMKVTLNGHSACKGIAQGEALVCRKPFMFLSYVDMGSGLVYAKGHELEGKNVKDKVIVSPCGCGSTGEEPSLLLLKEAGVAPRAVIVGSAEYAPGVIGAILADIPMVYGFDQNALGLIETGDHVMVDANNGIIEVTKREG